MSGRGSRGGPPRGRGRGGGPPRGGSPLPIGGPTGQQGALSTHLSASHVQAVGVKRASYGTQGRAINVLANLFPFSANPDGIIYHYDVDITTNRPGSKVFPTRVNLELIKQLQATNQDVFTPKAVYDGRKNMFSSRRLQLGPTNRRQFDLSGNGNGRPTQAPLIYTITINLVAEINTEILDRFIRGQNAQDNEVLTAMTALNVVIRMDPISKYAFNARSFFPNGDKKDLKFGLEALRGYFQSVRPSIGRLLLNIDITSAVSYKSGPLVRVCLEYLGKPNPAALSPASGLDARTRLKLQSFLKGMRISVAGNPGQQPKSYTIQGLSAEGANRLTFTRDGVNLSVATYFQQTNRALQYPNNLCVKVSSKAFIPLEICTVLPGQIVRKEIPEDAVRELLEFSTKGPQERLASIRRGTEILAYGQSEYIRHFGITIDTTAPLRIAARVLQPPTLKYGVGSREPAITPRDGAWNMRDKKLTKPQSIRHWLVLNFESEGRFDRNMVNGLVRDFKENCGPLGMSVENDPFIQYMNPQGNIGNQIKAAGGECKRIYGQLPMFLLAILPDFHNADLYKAVKYQGDVVLGIATQCLKASKCRRAKAQYWANVLLKVNPKLSGLNWEGDAIPALSDPNFPTMIMGADVIHPSPGNNVTPSFAAVVGSVNVKGTHYIAEDRVQTARVEIIADLGGMTKGLVKKWIEYHQKVEKAPPSKCKPKRIIFYRDGVSEGQFQQVLDLELPLIKQALRECEVSATITFIVVGKRHHIRFFPENPGAGDRSGNCPAGTVVDKGITHPLEFDFYLQSHGGLLGTSRSAHYSVLHDENNFTPDAIQSLSFSLCHVFMRATRSVSIPTPVYYADIVCTRAKSRFDPQANIDFSDAGSTTGTSTPGAADTRLATISQAFKPLHDLQTRRMYFL